MNAIPKLQVYKSLERAEHIAPDDILNKVTQEVIELLQGIENDERENIYEEAGDVLVNILSFCEELGIDISGDISSSNTSESLLSLL